MYCQNSFRAFLMYWAPQLLMFLATLLLVPPMIFNGRAIPKIQMLLSSSSLIWIRRMAGLRISPSRSRSLNGTVQMIFHNSEHKPPLAMSNTFKVDKSDNDNQASGANSSSDAPTSVAILTSTSVVYQDTMSKPETSTATSAVTSPEDKSKRESHHTLIIVASVLGGLVGLIILGIVLYFYWRYSMARREKKLGRTMLIPDVEDGDDQLQPLGRNRVLGALVSTNPFSSTIDVTPSPNEKLLPNSPPRLPFWNSTIAADIPAEQLNVGNLAGPGSEPHQDLQNSDHLVELEVPNRVPDVSGTAFQAMAAEFERMKLEIDWLKNQHLVDHFLPEYSPTRDSQ
ncbi:hypothetical protein C8J56DRAFT_1028430 [Mycena floridula]|nr:hypothetical protein C8J56DRAFT_1028430 [Mycena floridula]